MIFNFVRLFSWLFKEFFMRRTTTFSASTSWKSTKDLVIHSQHDITVIILSPQRNWRLFFLFLLRELERVSLIPKLLRFIGRLIIVEGLIILT